MEIVKDIAAIIGLVLSIISLITLSTKGGRAAIKSMFKRNTKEIVEDNARQTKDIEEIKEILNGIQETLGAVKEVSMQQCRDTIKEIYYKYCRIEEIPLYERKTADFSYAIYDKKFHGNTYAKTLYDEIIKWKIVVQEVPNMVDGEM